MLHAEKGGTERRKEKNRYFETGSGGEEKGMVRQRDENKRRNFGLKTDSDKDVGPTKKETLFPPGSSRVAYRLYGLLGVVRVGVVVVGRLRRGGGGDGGKESLQVPQDGAGGVSGGSARLSIGGVQGADGGRVAALVI